jgi:NAD(P)-dependent dehydrogenase (short-subunit alcohol dehydrogenase family)
MGTLDRKIAVITGATSGIGARMAELFAAQGAQVVIAGRRKAEGEELAERLGASFVRTDVAVEADVEALIAYAVDRHGRLDVLVNNAGDSAVVGSVTEVDLAEVQQLFAVHVGGTLSGIKYAARVMLRQESGSIITVASNTARLAGYAALGYTAAKAAVIQLTREAAIELGGKGIRVNSISPGPILTSGLARAIGMDPSHADRAAASLAPVLTAALENMQPIRRVGRTDDVAQAALWLASDQSSFVTGHDLVVDGGISAGRPASVGRAERAGLTRVFAELRP